MYDLDDAELNAVSTRLETVVSEIAFRHRSAGAALTWNLLHEIEDEAFRRLQDCSDLDPLYIRMLKSSPMMKYARTDQLVDFGESNAIPAAFLYIQRAFKRVDA